MDSNTKAKAKANWFFQSAHRIQASVSILVTSYENIAHEHSNNNYAHIVNRWMLKREREREKERQR